MTKKRRNYPKQFKIDAVKLVTEQGYKISEAARNLGINPNVLRCWEKQFETESNKTFLGKGHSHSGALHHGAPEIILSKAIWDRYRRLSGGGKILFPMPFDPPLFRHDRKRCYASLR